MWEHSPRLCLTSTWTTHAMLTCATSPVTNCLAPSQLTRAHDVLTTLRYMTVAPEFSR